MQMTVPNVQRALLLALIPLSPALRRGDELATVLAAARGAAAHAELRAQPLRAQGSARYLGAQGDFTLELHPGGAFRRSVGGALPEVLMSDGRDVWQSDWSGLARPLELGEREEALLFAAVAGGGWLDQGGPVVVALAPEPAAEGEIALDLSLAHGLEHGTLALDAETHLVRTLSLGHVVWRFEDYRSPLGFPFPFRVRGVEHGGSEEDFTLTSLARAPDLKPEALARGAEAPADVRFDPAVAPLVESKRANTGHVLVHPRLSGKDVGWFILDTGAGALCLSPKVGDELGLAEVGTVTAAGVGGSVPAKLRRGGELAVGPATLLAPTFVELDLAFLEPYFGVPVAGILGYDFFARAVVAVDYAAPRVEVYAPGAFALPEGEAWGRLVLDRRLPCVEATFEGDRTGIFRIDTGASGTVQFHAAAVERLGLLEGRDTKPMQVGGVGGSRSIRSGDLAWFELAGHRRAPLEAGFEAEEGPQEISAHIAGTLGGDLLAPFTMVLDLPGRRIAFLPRPE